MGTKPQFETKPLLYITISKTRGKKKAEFFPQAGKGLVILAMQLQGKKCYSPALAAREKPSANNHI